MDESTKAKTVNMEDMQAHTRVLHNKGIGSSGTCSTAAATAAKAVTLGTTFELVTGATILVTFTNGISVAGATLAVTHTPIGGSQTTETAKAIYYRGAALGADMVKAGARVLLRYNGTQFDIIGDLNIDSGFSITEDDTNGLDILSAIGNATITEDNTNGLDILTF